MESNESKNESLLLSAKQASVELFNGVRSDWDLLAAARKKQIPHLRLGKLIFFSPETIREWIKEQSIASIQLQETTIVNGIRRLK